MSSHYLQAEFFFSVLLCKVVTLYV